MNWPDEQAELLILVRRSRYALMASRATIEHARVSVELTDSYLMMLRQHLAEQYTDLQGRQGDASSPPHHRTPP